MICQKCGKMITDGSTFCKHCGTKIASDKSVEEESPFLKLANGDEEVAKLLMSMFVQNRSDKLDNVKKNYEKSHSSVHTNAYGSMNEPIYVDDIEGEKKYLARLTSENGKKLTWARKGSQEVEGIDGVLDIYISYTPDGKEYGELWINMYSDAIPTMAPVGYILDGDKTKTVGYQTLEKEDSKRLQAADGTSGKADVKTTLTKKRLNPTKIVYGIVLVGALVFGGIQFLVNNRLSQRIDVLNTEMVRLEEELSKTRGELLIKESELTIAESKAPKHGEDIVSNEDVEELKFFHENAVIVPDDGLNQYHYYGCTNIDLSAYWIYNKEAAERDGYSLCPLCEQMEESKRPSTYYIFKNLIRTK